MRAGKQREGGSRRRGDQLCLMLPAVPSGEDWEGSGFCSREMAEGQSRFGEHGASRMATITTVTPLLCHAGEQKWGAAD